MLLRPLLLFSLIFSSVTGRAENVSRSCAEEYILQHAALTSYTYSSFDQTKGSGWRALFDLGCPSEARDLIVDYLKIHESVSSLYLHAAQMEFTLERREESINFLKRAIRTEKIPEIPFKFNNYILALIAYAQRDERAFDKNTEVLREYSNNYGNRQNWLFLQALKNNFNGTYASAVDELARNLAQKK